MNCIFEILKMKFLFHEHNTSVVTLKIDYYSYFLKKIKVAHVGIWLFKCV